MYQGRKLKSITIRTADAFQLIIIVTGISLRGGGGQVTFLEHAQPSDIIMLIIKSIGFQRLFFPSNSSARS
jgi:hypothetical protein